VKGREEGEKKEKTYLRDMDEGRRRRKEKENAFISVFFENK